MRPHSWLSVCALACAGGLPAGPATAQTPPAIDHTPAPPAATPAPAHGATLSLADALELAWQRAVSARESAAQRRNADAGQAVAARPWAAPPALEIGLRQDADTPRGREAELGLAVPLWLPGQRAAAAALAQGTVAQAEAATQRARLQLAGALREAAWALAALQAEATQAEAWMAAQDRLADDVARRVQAGDLARADALVARAEALSARAQHAEVVQRLQAARTHWQQLTGSAAAPALDEPTAPVPAAARVDDAHPALRHARLVAEQADQRVALMQRSRREPPELSVGLRQESPGGGESRRHSLVVGVRLPFGTDDRNRPLEAEALGELDVAQTAEQRLREQLDADLATAQAALASARARLDAELARARLLRERATLIDTSFRAGESPLPELLQALSAAAQAEAAVARHTAALGLARAQLQQALGRLP